MASDLLGLAALWEQEAADAREQLRRVGGRRLAANSRAEVSELAVRADVSERHAAQLRESWRQDWSRPLPTPRREEVSELRVLARIRLGVDRWAAYYTDGAGLDLNDLMAKIRDALREFIPDPSAVEEGIHGDAKRPAPMAPRCMVCAEPSTHWAYFADGTAYPACDRRECQPDDEPDPMDEARAAQVAEAYALDMATARAVTPQRPTSATVPVLARHQPCGCIVCVCENEDDPDRCLGCGARHCGTHPVGKLPNPAYAPRDPNTGRATSCAARRDGGAAVREE